jgi:hypothetical protein
LEGRSLSVEAVEDLQVGLEIVALVLTLMGSAAPPLACFLGRPLDLPVGAILLATSKGVATGDFLSLIVFRRMVKHK